jgi:L-iditol 2-dehydrogenase
LKFRSSAKIFPHVDGTLTELVNHPATHCHKLPENVSYDAGALVEPLSVCLHAIRRSNPAAGSSALVMGAGAIGLLTAALLSVHGVTSITIADIDSSRLEIAASLPYSLRTVLIPKTGPPPTAPIEERLSSAQTLASTVKENLPSDSFGFDLAYDCTGIESCIQTSIYALAPGSKLVLVGMGRPIQMLPIGAAALREVDIVGVFRYANCYPAAIRLTASGKLDGVLSKLVTHRIALDKGLKGFELASKGVDAEGKAVVKVVLES